ncbi:MAG TPA: LLM class flavin-dependent oxidoreductase [Chloroflexia bacterium]|jgi:alkanesulfonate monooxygenase SsuD/methylene tetrahydromethanopterin reductase-like flavin-dependent oxidoreductase (luciferase family)
MRYGVIVPNFGEYSDARTVAGLAREAEEAGWDGFFIWDQMSMDTPEPVADPWIVLAAVAMSTSRVRLGPLVTPIARRRPWKLAREAVTLDHLSGGRLILGVGLGAFQHEEFEALGDVGDPRVRAEMLDEGLQVLVGLWSGLPFSFEGKHYHIQEARFLPTPLQKPRIPIWVAGNWPTKAPFRRAARWDGVIPGWDIMGGQKQHPEEVAAMIEYIQSHRTSEGPFEVAYGAKSTGDPAQDASITRPYIEAGITWWLEDLNPWRGTLPQMRERVRKGPPK